MLLPVVPRRIVCLPGLGFLFALWASAAAADTGLLRLPPDMSNVWLRHVVKLPDRTAGSNSILSVAGNGVVSVYFNGQQLTRGRRLPPQTVLRFDVTALTRTGPNGLALSVHADPDQEAAVAVSLTDGDRNAADLRSGWKMKTTPPPVGWQHTDFNPHGWTDVSTDDTTRMNADGLTQETVTWRRQAPPAGFSDPLELRDGDHVVLLGGTFIERAARYGHLETGLSLFAGDRHVTFRNLGWSGDTVFAESRGIFRSPAHGYQQLIEHVRAEEPTVILICYGQNEAMTDSSRAGRQKFRQGLQTLLNDLSTTGARFLLMTPHPLLPAPDPIPDPARFNRTLEDFAVQIRELAKEQNVSFADLFSDFPRALRTAHRFLHPDRPLPDDLATASLQWTDNGMHFNETGYACMAVFAATRCFHRSLPNTRIQVHLKQTTADAEAVGAAIRQVMRQDDGTVTLRFRASAVSPAPVNVTITGTHRPCRIELETEEGTVLCSADTAGQNDPVSVWLKDPRYDELRRLIIRKNELYFHRWRPQNITYLYLFRKHEQGNNAAEIAMFDPLIAELEQQIHIMRQSPWRKLTLRPAEPTH